MRAWWLASVVVLAACGSDAAPAVYTTVDVAVDTMVDVAVDTTNEVEEVDAATEVEVSDELAARSYCELTVDLFCPYYLRCGRMAVPDLATCHDVFLESCNARYEPIYAALADRSELVLSRTGIARCGEHLAIVACEQQIFDLDGGCDQVWRGQVAATDAKPACGLGIESFICDATSTCVIGLDFCGTCVPFVSEDGTCDLAHRCPGDGDCVEGRCVARAPVGAACGDGIDCVLGANCSQGVCAAPAIVGLDQVCDQGYRCPYRAACVAGRCQATGLLGEACGAAGCASGACVDGTCVAFLDPGASCTSHGSCRSGRCEAGQCAALTSPCLE